MQLLARRELYAKCRKRTSCVKMSKISDVQKIAMIDRNIMTYAKGIERKIAAANGSAVDGL